MGMEGRRASRGALTGLGDWWRVSGLGKRADGDTINQGANKKEV